MSRKTIEVSKLVDIVNGMCKNGSAQNKGERQGAMLLLEQVLHDTGNYKGFRSLLKEEVADGNPGINYLNGLPHPDYKERFANTDSTRVMYF